MLSRELGIRKAVYEFQTGPHRTIVHRGVKEKRFIEDLKVYSFICFAGLFLWGEIFIEQKRLWQTQVT